MQRLKNLEYVQILKNFE